MGLSLIIAFLAFTPYPAPQQGSANFSSGQEAAMSRTLLNAGDADPDTAEEILEGRSIGPVHLGDSLDRVQTHFKPKHNVDEQVSLKCHEVEVTEFHWVDLALHRSGVWFYFRDGMVFQIRASTTRFRTSSGVTVDSAAELVRKSYPDLSSFRLLNSGNQATGWKDHVFWVGERTGIAFELYYNSDAKEWRVLGVYVFKPNEVFQPGGCIYDPQEWKKIDPYSFGN